MAKIQRKTQKIFAGASNIDEKAIFGSMKTGNPEYSNNIEDLQSAEYEQGWQEALTLDNVPFLEEMNGVQYVLSSQLAYLLQMGVSEWDANTIYYANSFVQLAGIIYKSLTDDNTGNNPATDTTNWQPFIDDALSATSENPVQNKVIQAKINELLASIETNRENLAAHLADYNNPHKVTAEQLGLASAYTYKGTVATYDDLPASGQKIGDTYNIEQADESKGIPAGANVAWNGTTWDLIGGDLSAIMTDIDSLRTEKQNVLTAGDGINIENNIISVNSSGTSANTDLSNLTSIGNNKIGIKGYSNAETFTINDFVINYSDNKSNIYRSLIEQNKGNPLTDTTKWQKLSLGGSGGGFQVGDIGLALYVDESKGLRRYLNGQIIEINDQTTEFLNWVKAVGALYPSLLITEANWQAAKKVSAVGQVGHFVLDEEAGTLRLPAVVNAQGLFDLSKLGITVPAGLPNILGSIITDETTVNGAFYNSGPADQGSPNDKQGQWTTLDASRSNPIYGRSHTVQPEAIQYPYFIQIATGQETEVNIKNEIELNNPYTLFESKYSEKPLYNTSWLLSNSTYHSGTVYVTAYEALQVEANSEIEAGTTTTLPSGTSYTKRDLSVVASTEIFTDYDFVLNTADKTFRLPLRTKTPPTTVGTTVTIKPSTTSGSNDAFLLRTSSKRYAVAIGSNNTNNRTNTNCLYAGTYTAVNDSCPAYSGVGLAGGSGNDKAMMYDGGLMGVIDNTSLTSNDTDLNLYFYIGETVQNANLINAGRIEEQLSKKLDKSAVKAYVIESYQNGTSGYMLYSDNTLVQWANQKTDNTTINLLKEYANTDYAILGPIFYIQNSGRQTVEIKTTTSFTTGSDTSTTGAGYWMTIGKGA